VSGAKPVLEKALDLLPDSSSEHGWLLARFAITVGSETGDKDSSRKALRRAIEIGEAVGDVDLVTRAYAHIAQSFDDEFDPLNAIEAAESAIAIGEEHSSQELNTTGRANGVLARSYSRFGRMEKAKPHFDGLIENVERFRFRALMASWRVTQAKWSRMEGDFARSQELVEEYAAIAPVEASADWFRVVATYDTGNLEEADQLLSKAMDEWESVHFYGGNVPMIATLAPLVGHRAVFDRYEEMLRTARGMAGNPLFGDQQLSRAIAIGMLAVANGDRDEASVQRAMIEPYAGMASPDQLIVHDRALGHIQHLLGELDEAASYFEAARNLSRSAGWKRELAIVLAFEAETLVQRDAPGDSAKAVELQDEAIAIAQELGMKPLLERVLAQREILNA
jgi:tetratricopeptide (TPR) repeat protein